MPAQTDLNCTPELTRFLAARDRAATAQSEFAEALAKLKALATPPVRDRKPTLVGGLRAHNAHQQRAAFVAAALGMRPSGRY